MSTVLLVTNDFPPTIGGIQSYLRDFVSRLDPHQTIVYTSTQDEAAAAAFDAAAPYTVYRAETAVMLPMPAVARRMSEIIRKHQVETVWFGASAPLGLLAPAARRAGARRIISTTHGHEVGWSMLPGARAALRRIGNASDVVTYISRYTLGRLRPAFGEHPKYAALPSGVDTDFFRPASPEQRAATRQQFSLDDGTPLVICISRLVRRKGQDQLIRVIDEVGARLMIVGDGPDRRRLEQLAEGKNVRFTGAVEREVMRDLLAASDVFAMPARTRGAGLDVEGLGIVYLEAQACGIPVLAGDSGGAPETVTNETGVVVSGRDRRQVSAGLRELLDHPQTSGRDYVQAEWSWDVLGARLRCLVGHE